MNPATDDPMPESPDARPRLGDLLRSAGLITEEQLDESLTVARTAGKPLGHVLVEQGLVPAHSIAMALADQHGGPLKTEFGFATGRGTTPRPTSLDGEALPVLRLAPAPARDEPAPAEAAAVVVQPIPTPAEPALPDPAASAATALLHVQLEAETAARLGAEARANELLGRVERLQAELEATGARAAEEAAAPLRERLEELRGRLEEQSATDELLATTRKELATAVAVADDLRLKLAAEHATNERATAALDTLNAQVEELRNRRSADAAAFSAGEGALVTVRAELAAARAEAETLRTTLTELEQAAQEAQTSIVVPLHGELDELRAVIELQEQALAAAAARELAPNGDARSLVDDPATRAYSEDAHLLFAPGVEGYEILERSGSSPAPGELVQLSGGRTCRVLRIGPSPFPGVPEVCAYLELV